MAARKRNPVRIEADRTTTLRLCLMGHSETEIARQLGVGQSQVAYDLKRIRAEWNAGQSTRREQLIGEELARIRLMESEAWAQWEQSKRERETKLSEMASLGGPGEGRTRASVRVEQRGGNPAYLGIVQWCIERRCRLLGLDAPTKVEAGTSLAELAREAEAILEAEEGAWNR